MNSKIARIHESILGWHISDNGLPYLDERGTVYPTRNAAIAMARWRFSHYVRPNGRIVLL